MPPRKKPMNRVVEEEPRTSSRKRLRKDREEDDNDGGKEAEGQTRISARLRDRNKDTVPVPVKVVKNPAPKSRRVRVVDPDPAPAVASSSRSRPRPVVRLPRKLVRVPSQERTRSKTTTTIIPDLTNVDDDEENSDAESAIGEETDDEDDEEEQSQGEEERDEKIIYLLAKTCMVYRASPLFNVRELVKNKVLMKEKTQRVHAALVESLSESMQKKYSHSIDIIPIKNTRIYQTGENESVFVEIVRITKNNANAQSTTALKQRTIFTGLFTTVKPGVDHTRFINKEAIHDLPLFLVHTANKYWGIIKDELGAMFECSFLSLEFNWSNMVFLAGRWLLATETDLDREDKVKINFHPIRTRNDENEVGFEAQMNLDTWRDELDRLKNEESESLDEVMSLWKLLTRVFDSQTGIQLQSTCIDKICYKTFVLTAKGRVKTMPNDITGVGVILHDLTHAIDMYKRLDGEDERTRFHRHPKNP